MGNFNLNNYKNVVAIFYPIRTWGHNNSQDFRQDLGRETCEVFYRKVSMENGDPKPSFNVQGLNFFFTKKFGIYFVATTKYNVSPSFVMDIIYRMMKVFRDYCGVLSEESIRKNFVLIYEIIDEIIDYGHP